jgi:hypothetical protein
MACVERRVNRSVIAAARRHYCIVLVRTWDNLRVRTSIVILSTGVIVVNVRTKYRAVSAGGNVNTVGAVISEVVSCYIVVVRVNIDAFAVIVLYAIAGNRIAALSGL